MSEKIKYTGEQYEVSLEQRNTAEMLELWEITHIIDKRWGTGYWAFKGKKLIMQAFPFESDLDLNLQFVHLVGKMQERKNDLALGMESDEYGQREIKRMRHYDELER